MNTDIRTCRYCGEPLFRKIGKDGILEYPCEFKKRQFCGCSCAMKYRVGVEKRKYKCEYCGKKFIDYESNRKGSKHIFCSTSCSAKFLFSKPLPKCKVCGKEVRMHRNSFCSRICRGKFEKTGQIVKCVVCQKEFYLPLNRIKNTNEFHCSQRCRKQNYSCQLEEMRLKLRQIRLSNGLTLPEKIVKKMLDSLHVQYERERNIGKYFIDFFLPNEKICIEVDGDYWHGNKATDKYIGNKYQKDAVKSDSRKKIFLENKDYKLIRFWETDIKNNKEKVYADIKRAIQ